MENEYSAIEIFGIVGLIMVLAGIVLVDVLMFVALGVVSGLYAVAVSLILVGSAAYVLARRAR